MTYSTKYERKARRIFSVQKHQAGKRGVEFLFTFEEWENWWLQHLGKGWQKKRGIQLGQYCMARKGDRGPYSVENVECILHSQNSVDRKANGRAKGGIHRGTDNGNFKHGRYANRVRRQRGAPSGSQLRAITENLFDGEMT